MKDCPPKLVCFTLEEAGYIADKILVAKQHVAILEAENAKLKALRAPRLGWQVGCGLGVGYDMLRQAVDVEPTCSLTYGIRF